jgi:serine phosphatase RsbU (regulator of sigma subunit)
VTPKEFKILVVEDNSLNRKVIVQKLKKNNYLIEEAENGMIALEKVKSWQPDLILLDVMMPVMDGFQVLDILRQTQSQVELPIILVTAMQDSEDIVKGFHLGANDYLPKNFNTEELLARVNTGLKIRSYHNLLKLRNNTIERELDIARLIQKKILPTKVPYLSGYSIGSLYVPMDKVGGDYYDYFEKEDYCDFFMADVSGHGVPGALIGSILKMSTQYLHRSHYNPTEILKVMDQAVSERGAMGMFATASIVRLFPKEARIEYSNAGHHPLLIHRRSNDTFIELTTPGSPLGINYDFKKLNYIAGEFQLVMGDRIILFTDGIIETVDEKDVDFETSSWINFLEDNKTADVDDLSKKLIQTLKDYSHKNTFEDDLTWVVIDYSGN